MNPEEFLEKLFNDDLGDLQAPRKHLVHSGGKYSWCDELVRIQYDENNIPLEFPYTIGTIFVKGKKPIAHVFYEVSDWYDFDVDTTPQDEEPLSEEELEDELNNFENEMRSYC